LTIPVSYDGRDVYACLYLAWLQSVAPPDVVAVASQFTVPTLAGCTPLTAEQIRALAQKIYIYDVSIPQLTCDLLKRSISDEKKQEIVSAAATIDALSAKTEGHRMTMYIELLLHMAFKK